MLGKLILLFTLTPLIELFLLLKLSDITSVWATIGIVLTTGVVGAFLAKSQGRIILSKIRIEIDSGRMPGNELINGLCVLVGGALLLTPGIITDIIGFSLVIPGTREIFKTYIKNKIKNMIQTGNTSFYFRKW